MKKGATNPLRRCGTALFNAVRSIFKRERVSTGNDSASHQNDAADERRRETNIYKQQPEILECLIANGFVYDCELDRYVKFVKEGYSLKYVSTGHLHSFGKIVEGDSHRIVILRNFSTKKDWNEIVSRVAELDDDLVQVPI